MSEQVVQSPHQFQFPTGFSAKFSNEIRYSAESPDIERDGGKIIIPVFIQDCGEDGYGYIPVAVDYVGQDINDYLKCVSQSYAAIRKHFYGDALFQRELEDDDLLNLHITAVKCAFPKPNAEVVKKYSKYKIQRECEKLHVEGHENIYAELEEAIKAAGKWSSWQNIIDVRSDNEELIAVLPMIRQIFPTVDVDEVLDKCIC